MTQCKHGWWSTVKWSQVEAMVRQHNTKLADILGKLSNSKAAPLLKRVKYPFGEEIVSSGVFKLPCNCGECSKLINGLTTRTTIPLGLVLNKRIEVLTQGEDKHRTVPLRLLEPGDMFGVFEIAERMRNYPVNPPWTLYAGARTVVPLWQFRNSDLQAAIKRQLGDLEGTQDAADMSAFSDILPSTADGVESWHEAFWPMLKALARNVDSDWGVEVLFLDVDWDSLEIGQPLRAYIFETAWDQSRELRESGRASFQHENAVVSRIVQIMLGEGIGFTPCLQNGELGPFALIQKKLISSLLTNSHENISRQGRRSLPKLPLLLLPSRMPTDMESRRASVTYFSLNNLFTEALIKGHKFSNKWQDIAYDTKKAARDTRNGRMQLDFFSALSAEIKFPQIVFYVDNYKNNYFPQDFSEQLSLAKEVGWTGSLAHDDVLTTKAEGFFVSFARIASRS